ncbi:MAG: UDP-N-acetylmuramoyl-tripeptide--D-alanyl-D-alanine ligase [Candidatus Portnoybacteria bacterium]|nr:UDP-N-acetylmuramoyl-tripeptide--D-alanyl-D-alanine ligase [Candidatus Portnoybacteria bacterium]
MKKFVELILKTLASKILKKYKPFIVGVTGSMGKTSTREAIAAVLESKYEIRQNFKNYNNEIGVPLTILGLESGGRSIFKWLWIFIKGSKILFFKIPYPEVLVLEMGADRPGDIKYLTSFVNCDIGVITGIGDIPAHVEFFSTPVQLAREKSRLIDYLEEKDRAVLNFDDARVKKLTGKTRAEILSYGFSEDAKIRAFAFGTDIGFSPETSGINFQVEFGGKTFSVKKEGILGRHQVYPMLAAMAVGLAMEMNIIETIGGLKRYRAPKGRLNLIKGIKTTWILDDTYNSSPAAAFEALKTLAEFDGRRKIAVLGDMLELGEFTEEAHKSIGKEIRNYADIFFAVGDRMKFAALEAAKSGMAQNNILWFETADAARMPLQHTIQKGDVILVKGSQSMRMERIVEEIMAEPDRAAELLVRQEREWKEQ